MPEPTKPPRAPRKKKMLTRAEARRRAESERPARPSERRRPASAEARRRAESERPARPASRKPAAKPVSPFMQKLRPSPELARVVGKRPLSRVSVIKKTWLYIKRHKLQNRTDKRMIDLDEALRGIFGDREQVSIFELANGTMRHLLPVP